MGRTSKRWNITEHLFYHLTFTSELVTSRQEIMLLEECGVTLSEWRIMAVISTFRPMSSKDITRVTSMNKVAVSRGVSSLVERGYIERTVDAADTRIQWLTLTKAGEERFQIARRAVENFAQPLISALEPGEAELLKKLLMRLRVRLGEVTGDERGRSEGFIFRDR